MIKDNKLFIVAGTLAFVFAFLFLVYKLTNISADYSKVTVVTPTDHSKWSPIKKHVLVEYSDLQCPACRAFNELLDSFEATASPNANIPKKVTLVYRHFPLYQIHENAFETAYAAEAAGKQDKFFEMLSSIFKDQIQLTGNKDTIGFLLNKARALGLDTEQFKKDMESEEVQAKVKSDLADGEKAGINSTPTFFLDGKKLEFKTPDEFIRILKKLD